ncbi:MAG: hypothetical protein H0U73_08140, partial [Tatlockia sp.]|nr:hypothetical protein [Tatlockia sp.]
DLTECNNIRSATVLLGTYIDTPFSWQIALRQMVNRFSPRTDSSVYLLPLQSHFHSQYQAPLPYHLGKALAQWGYLKYPEEAFTQKIHYWYNLKKGDIYGLHEEHEICELFEMTEFPEHIELYDDCFILLKEKEELYFINKGKIEVRECRIIDNELHYLRKYLHKVSKKLEKPSETCKVRADYYFTPTEYRQSILGTESPIVKDPCYIDWLTSKARSILTDRSNLHDIQLNEEKAVAIVAISKLTIFDDYWIQALINDEEKFKKLRKIINKTEEIVTHLVNNCETSNRPLIEENAIRYKNEIFERSLKFFSGNQSPKQKKQFADDLYRSELSFRQQALSVDADLLRSTLKLITNFITHISGLGLIINGINKYLTGNWLLFSHTRNENIIRDNRIDIVNGL